MALEKLDLGTTNISDLRPLKGMPLRWLSVHRTQVTDISALEGMPLEFLNISRLNRVADLKVLRGAPLRQLWMEHTAVTDLKPLASCTTLEVINLCNTKISDLRPLAGRKLTECYVVSTRVRDLQVLRGMPLRKLHADFTEIIDLSPIFECATLEELLLPPKAKDIVPLRTLANMQTISFYRDESGVKPGQTPEEFWAEVDGNKKK
jgi:Leucine-rich repeat (LRR) protein